MAIESRVFACVFGAAMVLPAVAWAAPDPWLAGGQDWSYRAGVTLTEPGVAARAAEYVDLLVDFSGGAFTSLPNEVRVADATGAEIPSVVHHVDVANKKAHVLFARDVAKSAAAKVYVYWGNAAAAAPAGYVHPAMKVAFYTEAATYDATYELPLATRVGGLSLHGKIGVQVTPVVYTAYSTAGAEAYRFGLVSLLPTVVTAMKGSTVYADLGIGACSSGAFAPGELFGLSQAAGVQDNACKVPATTTYVTQDFAPNAVLDFPCGTLAVGQDAGSVIEVIGGSAPAGAALLRWDGNHTFSNAKVAKFRGFFFHRYDGFTADATTLLRRMFEYVLQDARVGIAQGATDTGRKCYADADKDGFGGAPLFTINQVCNDAANGVADNALDCDDARAAVKPGATEICNAIDDDCDGRVDEGGDALCGDRASGKICSQAAKACVDGCGVPVPGTVVDAGDAGDAATLHDAGDGGVLVTGARNGCPAGLFCSVTKPATEGQCTTSCAADAQCALLVPTKPFCAPADDAGNVCVGCRTNADCGSAAPICSPTSRTCVAAPAPPDAGTSSSSSSSSSGSPTLIDTPELDQVPVTADDAGCACTAAGGGGASAVPLVTLAALALAGARAARRKKP